MIENTMRNKDYAVLLYHVVCGVDEKKAILFLSAPIFTGLALAPSSP
jgi:hypothetical protein